MTRSPLVGTHLRQMLLTLGVTDRPGCGCKGFAAEMDRLGPATVRADAARYVGILRANAKTLGWAEYARIVSRAIRAGLFLNPLDPYTGLVLEACRRAESYILRFNRPTIPV